MTDPMTPDQTRDVAFKALLGRAAIDVEDHMLMIFGLGYSDNEVAAITSQWFQYTEPGSVVHVHGWYEDDMGTIVHIEKTE